MDIKSLMVFQTLAETLHYGQAAAVLHMSPSTISRTITRLEEVLNVQLVQRDNRNVILTWQGQKLLKTADDIVSQ